MDNLVIQDGFSPYFERREDRLHDETFSVLNPVPPERRRAHPLLGLDPRAFVASGPRRPRSVEQR